MQENFVYALTLTLIAGLSTGIGAIVVLFSRRISKNFLSLALGFSAGVMLYISFVDIIPKATDALLLGYGQRVAQLYVTLAFFGGIALIAIIDKLVPKGENPHEMTSLGVLEGVRQGASAQGAFAQGAFGKEQKLMRMGVLTALAIGIHNFPEGIATFLSALNDPQSGLLIAVAIGIHNIPEGIAVAVPVYLATHSQRRAIGWGFLSGLAEPIGALVGYALLRPYITDSVFGIIFAMVAGIMVYISLDELLPAAREWGHHHSSIWGLVMGMAAMATAIIIMA